MKRHAFLSLSLLVALASAAPVQAHFKLLMPESWLKEDSTGNPQKTSPCGTADGDPAITGKAPTEVDAGSTLKVQLQETVYHPGYFRVAFAENRADLKNPPLTDPMGCYYDDAAVVEGAAHDNVLMDGLLKTTTMFASNRSPTFEVKLPDKPCDNCTLQVVQVMRGHGGSSCFYFHCANLKLVAPDSGGSGMSSSVPVKTGSGGHGTARPAAKTKSSGCTVASLGARVAAVRGVCAALAVLLVFVSSRGSRRARSRSRR